MAGWSLEDCLFGWGIESRDEWSAIGLCANEDDGGLARSWWMVDG